MTWENADFLLTADGAEYELSTTGMSLTGDPAVEREETLRTAQARLREAGWTLRPVVLTEYFRCADLGCGPDNVAYRRTLFASRGDTILTLEIYDAHPQYTDPNVYLSANLDRATPWAAHVAGVIGGLLGLLGGWLPANEARRSKAVWRQDFRMSAVDCPPVRRGCTVPRRDLARRREPADCDGGDRQRTRSVQPHVAQFHDRAGRVPSAAI